MRGEKKENQTLGELGVVLHWSATRVGGGKLRNQTLITESALITEAEGILY